MQPPSFFTDATAWTTSRGWIVDTTSSTANVAVFRRWVELSNSSSTSTTGIYDLEACDDCSTSSNWADSTATITNKETWRRWVIRSHITSLSVPRNDLVDYEAVRRRNEALVQAEGERKSARERAEVLLNEVLTPDQRQELKENGYFTLRLMDDKGTRFYRIYRGRSRNVQQVTEDGRRIMTLCAHPNEHVPDADTIVAQKLMLMTNEQEFLRVANRS